MSAEAADKESVRHYEAGTVMLDKSREGIRKAVDRAGRDIERLATKAGRRFFFAALLREVAQDTKVSLLEARAEGKRHARKARTAWREEAGR